MSGGVRSSDSASPPVREGHYTSKPWHFIDAGDGKWIIRCDTSYATAGVMECLIEPRVYLSSRFGEPPHEVRVVLAERSSGVADVSTASDDELDWHGGFSDG